MKKLIPVVKSSSLKKLGTTNKANKLSGKQRTAKKMTKSPSGKGSIMGGKK